MLFLICVFWASMFFLALYEFTKEVYWCLLMYVPVICAFALFFMYADYPQANVSNAMKVVSLKVAIKRINRRKKLFALLDKEADDTIKDDILMELSAKPMGEDDLLMRLNTSNEFKELNIKESNRI
ncbi:MAG TPA: hypothetical protein PKV16_02420 [Caldisericia bacterium]|nr:hypothetical protein [Caldisericia bacterium]HPF48169.1 hypothetical protein [Caldisericia bacterium]HPI83895.1 hypothetical protein [Caldisericia bacterium]HPQ92622.1 hypothetical protein [Caldisericia bacterium]HRV74280.1 hypothetical protein [Caldisericia bacterium]